MNRNYKAEEEAWKKLPKASLKLTDCVHESLCGDLCLHLHKCPDYVINCGGILNRIREKIYLLIAKGEKNVKDYRNIKKRSHETDKK